MKLNDYITNQIKDGNKELKLYNFLNDIEDEKMYVYPLIYNSEDRDIIDEFEKIQSYLKDELIYCTKEELISVIKYCPIQNNITEENNKYKSILEKVLKYVTNKEDRFYKPIEEGKYETGSMANMRCMFQAASYQDIRYFIENLLEEEEQ